MSNEMKTDRRLQPLRLSKKLSFSQFIGIAKDLLIEENQDKIDRAAFIFELEQDLEEYDRLILEEVKTIQYAHIVGRLIIDRQAILLEVKETVSGDELKRYEVAYKKSELLNDKLNHLLEIIRLNDITQKVNIKTTRPPKPELIFNQLFKKEYSEKADNFLKLLKEKGYTTKDNVWRETQNTNELAKVYLWFFDNGVFRQNDKTSALKCFCKQFGIVVCEKLSGNSELREITRKNMTETNFNSVDEKHFKTDFYSFLIK